MTDTVIQSGFTQESFEAYLASRQEPSWRTQLRRDAWETFEQLPFPQRNEEEWRRTDIRGLRLERFGFAGEGDHRKTGLSPMLSQGVDLGGQASAIDSLPQPSQLAEELSSQGVWFGSLNEAQQQVPDLLQKHLHTAFDPAIDKFAALHAAAASGGAFLYVPAGVQVNKPLHLWAGMTPGGVDFSHTLVVLEEGSEATLMAEMVGEGSETGFHCGAVELVVGPKARLRFVNLQNWGTGTWHLSRQKAVVHEDAELQWTIGALGARLAKVNQTVELVGKNAQAQVNGTMFTEGKQQLTYNTLQHHRVPHATSDLLYKGALQDKSRLVWRGMIKVDPGAIKTNGYQRNDNLMLSDNARVDSIPGLEIEADDVICTHGATAGQVSEEQIYYAQTRGLTRKEATRMIVAGFFQQVFDRITIGSVKHALADAIGRRIREYE